MTKRIELDPNEETVRLLIEDKVAPDELHWQILEPPEARRDEMEPATAITIELVPHED